ncbi:MAG: D-alanyl-D-alanine carboxypeptidase, partial [Dyella sp.]
GSIGEGNLHAKTGSMSYVHCLAGYVTTTAGERLAFAIMLNNDVPTPQSPSPNQNIDAIALLLAGLNQRQ